MAWEGSKGITKQAASAGAASSSLKEEHAELGQKEPSSNVFNTAASVCLEGLSCRGCARLGTLPLFVTPKSPISSKTPHLPKQGPAPSASHEQLGGGDSTKHPMPSPHMRTHQGWPLSLTANKVLPKPSWGGP